MSGTRGVSPADARRVLLALAEVVEGRSYGYPAFLLRGGFFARLRDDDTVLVLQLGGIAEREVLMRLEPRAFFFTEHYRDHPSVLIRLAEVPRSLFADVVRQAFADVAAQRPAARTSRAGRRGAAGPARRRKGRR